MANDFYTPGILSQAGGHAASLISDAGGAWGAAFQQLGQWTENEKMQNQQIAAREREQQIQIGAEKDRQSTLMDFETSKLAFASAIEQGMAPDEAVARYFSASKIGQAMQDRRQAATDGVIATGIFNRPVASLDNQETGHLAAQVQDLQQQALAAANSGDLVGAQSIWKQAESIKDNSEFRSNVFKASRSMLPLERQQSDVVYDPSVASRFAKAVDAGKHLSGASVITNGGDAGTADLIGQFYRDSTQLSPEMRKAAFYMSQAAASPDGKGPANWDVGSQYGHALLDVFNSRKSARPSGSTEDPAKLSDLMVEANKLVQPAFGVAKANGVSLVKVMGLVTGAVSSMTTASDSPEARVAAQEAVGRLITEGAKADPKRAYQLLSSIDFENPDISASVLTRDLPGTMQKFSQRMSDVELTNDARDLARVPGGKIDLLTAAKEFALESLGVGYEVSPVVNSQALVADTIRRRISTLRNTAAGYPEVLGGEPPTLQKAIVSGVCAELAAQYIAARGDTEAQKRILTAGAQVLIARGAPNDEVAAYLTLKDAMDLTGDKKTARTNPAGILTPDLHPDEIIKGIQELRKEDPGNLNLLKKQAQAQTVGSLLGGVTSEKEITLTGEQTDNLRDTYGNDPDSGVFETAENSQREQIAKKTNQAIDFLRFHGFSDKKTVDFDPRDSFWVSRGARKFKGVLGEAVMDPYDTSPISPKAMDALALACRGAPESDVRKMIADTLATSHKAINTKSSGEHIEKASIPDSVRNRLYASIDPSVTLEQYDANHADIRAARASVRDNRVAASDAQSRGSPEDMQWWANSRVNMPPSTLTEEINNIQRRLSDPRTTPEERKSLKIEMEGKLKLRQEDLASFKYREEVRHNKAMEKNQAFKEGAPVAAPGTGDPNAESHDPLPTP